MCAELKAQGYVGGGRILFNDNTDSGMIVLGLSDFQVDYIAVVDHKYSDCYLGPLLIAPKLL